MAVLSFFRIKFPAFGVDISDRTVKVAAVNRTQKSIGLASFGEERLEEGVVVEGKIQSPQKVADALERAISGMRGKPPKHRYVNCALPEEQSFVHLIQLPKMPQEELAKAVVWETEANIPLPLQQVYFDWQVIQESTDSKNPHYDVLVVAVARDVVDRYVEALELAHLIPVALEVESSAMARALLKFGFSYPPTLIMDFGETRAGLAIVSGESVRMTSTLVTAGKNFTELIAQKKSITKEAAEEQKRKFGIATDTPEGRANKEAVAPALERFILGVKEYIDYYKTYAKHDHSVYTLQVSNPQERGSFNFQKLAPDSKTLIARQTGVPNVTKVLLCGGETNLPGVPEYIAAELRLPAERANVWINLLPQNEKNPLFLGPRDQQRFTIAIGLALRSELL